MALTNTNILLNFAHGQEANLPSTYAQGTIYITTDSKRMYVDLPGTNTRMSLGNFELLSGDSVNSSTGAPNITLATGETNTFYVTKDSKGNYALWCHDGTGFKKIVNTSELNAAISALSTRVGNLETWKGQFESEVSSTYVKKAGDEMTGSLTMKQPTSGTTKVTVTGLPDPVANSDAANKNYVDTETAKRALVSHADTTGANGKGANNKFGHVKLSDSTSSDSAASAGVAATPKAVKAAYDLASQAKSAAEAIDLSPYVKHDGSVAMTGNLKLGDGKNNNRIINVADPANDQDAATKKYVDGLIGTDSNGTSVTGRIKALEDSLGEPATTGNATGTAYERIKKNAEDISGLSSALTTFTGTTAPATYLKLDGSNSPMKGELKMGDATAKHKITNLADGSAASDAATVKNVTAAVAAHADDAANATTLGHVKLSDATNDGTNDASKGVAATPVAVKSAKDRAEAAYTLASAAKGVADAALPAASLPSKLANYMPKAGGQFTGDVSFASGKYLTVVAPRANDTGKNDATPRQYVDTAVAGVDTKVENLKKDIKNLTNIMNFLGTTTTELADGSTTKTIVIGGKNVTAAAGDVVIYGAKEFVFDGAKWAEVGDVSAQDGAISDLQDTVGEKPTGTTIPDMDDTLWDEVTDLRTDLGEKTDTKDATGSAFARIADLADKFSDLDSEMTAVANQLVWKTF